jgi:hypothetical protein
LSGDVVADLVAAVNEYNSAAAPARKLLKVA